MRSLGTSTKAPRTVRDCWSGSSRGGCQPCRIRRSTCRRSEPLAFDQRMNRRVLIFGLTSPVAHMKHRPGSFRRQSLAMAVKAIDKRGTTNHCGHDAAILRAHSKRICSQVIHACGRMSVEYSCRPG
jgi:hypothetical protein